MEVNQIVIIVFVVLVILYFIINSFSKTSQLTKMADGKILQTITAASLKNGNNSMNFTYSMWIYVDDWNYKFGTTKTILDRAGGPTVSLGDKPNTLTIGLKYYSTDETATATATKPGISASQYTANAAACAAKAAGFNCVASNCDATMLAASTANQSLLTAGSSAIAGIAGSKISTCQIDNIPIQKWVNIIISLYGRTLDTYLDGKLVRTCVVSGVPSVDNTANISVTPGGGFSGWTTIFKYWSEASNPQDAYNIYKDGFGGSILGNALSKFRLRFSFISGNVEKGSFEI